MVQTYNSDWSTIYDQDTKKYSIPDDKENIQNLRVRWRGVKSEETTTKIYTVSNKNDTDFTNTSSGTTFYENATFPDVPNSGDFHKLRFVSSFRNMSGSGGPEADEATVVADAPYGTNSNSTTLGFSVGKTVWTDIKSYNESYTGQTGEARADYSGGDGLDVEIQAVAETQYTEESTTTDQTQDPSVTIEETGDTVTGPSSINDGETSDLYYPSIGSDQSTITFNHSINGSQKADFEFAYDWEYPFPEALGKMGIQIQGTTYKVALADPSHSGLDYSFFKVKHPTEGVLAADVVDTSEEDALPIKIHHPTKGELSFRKLQ